MFDFAERLNELQLTDEEIALFSALVIISAGHTPLLLYCTIITIIIFTWAEFGFQVLGGYIKNRGAEQVRCGERVSPSPLGLGRGHPLCQKFFLLFNVRMVYLVYT